MSVYISPWGSVCLKISSCLSKRESTRKKGSFACSCVDADRVLVQVPWESPSLISRRELGFDTPQEHPAPTLATPGWNFDESSGARPRRVSACILECVILLPEAW